MKCLRRFLAKILFLVIIASFIFSQESLISIAKSDDVVIVTPNNSIEVTIDSSDKATIYYKYYLNNSASTIIYNCTFLFIWAAPEGSVIEKIESNLVDLAINLER